MQPEDDEDPRSPKTPKSPKTPEITLPTEICREVFNVFARLDPAALPESDEPHRALDVVDLSTALSILHLGAQFEHAGGFENPNSKILPKLALAKELDEKGKRTLPFEEFEILANELEKDSGYTHKSKGTPRLIKKLRQHEMDDNELRRLREIFGVLGGDAECGDDEEPEVAIGELRTTARALGLEPDEAAISAAAETVNEDCSGGLDFGEFLMWIMEITPPGVHFHQEPKLMQIVREMKWTHVDIADFKAVFAIFDVDGDETIGVPELLSAMRSLGHEATKEDVEKMVANVDEDNDGSLDFIEFAAIVKNKMKEDEKEYEFEHDDPGSPTGVTAEKKTPAIVSIVRDMNWSAKQIMGFKKVFSRFDIDGDETVSTAELGILFKEMGNEMDEVELEKMVAEIDQDGSGSIDFIEFLGLLSNVQKPGTNENLRRSFLEAAVDNSTDHEFELKQLLMAVEGIEAAIKVENQTSPGSRSSIVRASINQNLKNAKMTRRSADASVPDGAKTKQTESTASKLLRCIEKVAKSNQKMKTQEKLQAFVLEWCCPAPSSGDRAVKKWHRSLDRWLRFCRGQTDKPRCRNLPASKRAALNRLGASSTSRVLSADQVMRRPPPSPLSASEAVCRPFSEGYNMDLGKRKPHGKAPTLWGWADAEKITAAAVAASSLGDWLPRLSRMESDLKLPSMRHKRRLSGLQIEEPPKVTNELTGVHGNDIFKVDWCTFETKLASQRRTREYKHGQPSSDLYPCMKKYVEGEVEEKAPGGVHGVARANEVESLMKKDELHWASESLVGKGSVPEWRKLLAERAQLQSCNKVARLAKRVPEVQMCKSLREAEEVSLADDSLDDTEMGAALRALDILLAPGDALSVGESGCMCRILNASGNRFTTRGLHELLQKIQLESLTSLDLSNNDGLNGHTAATLSEAMDSGELRHLKILKLEGLRIEQFRQWELLVNALPSCTRLEALSLADTCLGRESGDAQRDCIAVAEATSNMAGLKSLDLSANYFRMAGCAALGKALASTRSLQILCLAGNAGGFASAGMGTRDKDSALGFPPLQLLIEGLLSNACLNTLDLTSCHLAYEEIFCLEGVAVAHTALKTLLLADNPLGQEGVACIVRLLVQSMGVFEWCDLDGVRSNPPAFGVYQAESPSGKYMLNLGKPYHRAVLWRLLLLCLAKKLDPAQTLTQVEMGPSSMALKPVKDWASLFPKIEKNTLHLPTWQIPYQGFMKFECHVESSLKGAGSDTTQVVLNWIRANKSKVTLQRFVVLSLLWKQLQSESQLKMLAESIRSCCILKLSQLKYFLRTAPRFMVTTLVQLLYPCLESPERLALMDLVTGQDQKVVMREAKNLFYFNPSNPMGKYSLFLGSKTEVAVAERLITVNTWHRYIAETLELPDTSQHGDRHNFRNTTLDRKGFYYGKNFLLPTGSNPPTLGLDYVSPLRPDVREFPIGSKIFRELLRVLADSRARLFDKVLTVRILSHQLVFNPDQLVELLKAFPKDDRELEVDDILQMATQGFDEPRVELLVICWCRTADRPEVASPAVLYNSDVFPRPQVRILWQRLGRINTFDVANVCQLVPSNLGNRYELNLTQYEPHRLMEMILRLAGKEEGDNLVKCWYSEASYLSHTAKDGSYCIMYDYLIPATWNKAVPKVGTIRFEYVCKPEYLLSDFRDQLGEEYLSWCDQDCTVVDMENARKSN